MNKSKQVYAWINERDKKLGWKLALQIEWIKITTGEHFVEVNSVIDMTLCAHTTHYPYHSILKAISFFCEWYGFNILYGNSCLIKIIYIENLINTLQVQQSPRWY